MRPLQTATDMTVRLLTRPVANITSPGAHDDLPLGAVAHKRTHARAKPRNKKVDSGNANTAIDRHCEEPLRRSNPGAACCDPWIAHMGILASMVDFSFSCCGFFDVAGGGVRWGECAVELMEARFFGGQRG